MGQAAPSLAVEAQDHRLLLMSLKWTWRAVGAEESRERGKVIAHIVRGDVSLGGDRETGEKRPKQVGQPRKN